MQELYSGKAVDLWALGVTLYCLVYGNVPFLASSVPAVYEKIKNDEVVFPNHPYISDELKHLILNLLAKDPHQRITLSQIKVLGDLVISVLLTAYFKHVFFS